MSEDGEQLRDLIRKYEQRQRDLEERELQARDRITMLETYMPAVLSWNAWSALQAQQVTPAEVTRIITGQQLLPMDESYTRRLQQLENEVRGIKDADELASVGRKPSGSLTPDDIENMKKLQEIATNEMQLKKRIQSMERKELMYLATLQKADELRMRAEGITSGQEFPPTIVEAGSSAEGLQRRVMELEGEINRLKKKSEVLEAENEKLLHMISDGIQEGEGGCDCGVEGLPDVPPVARDAIVGEATKVSKAPVERQVAEEPPMAEVAVVVQELQPAEGPDSVIEAAEQPQVEKEPKSREEAQTAEEPQGVEAAEPEITEEAEPVVAEAAEPVITEAAEEPTVLEVSQAAKVSEVLPALGTGQKSEVCICADEEQAPLEEPPCRCPSEAPSSAGVGAPRKEEGTPLKEEKAAPAVTFDAVDYGPRVDHITDCDTEFDEFQEVPENIKKAIAEEETELYAKAFPSDLLVMPRSTPVAPLEKPAAPPAAGPVAAAELRAPVEPAVPGAPTEAVEAAAPKAPTAPPMAAESEPVTAAELRAPVEPAVPGAPTEAVEAAAPKPPTAPPKAAVSEAVVPKVVAPPATAAPPAVAIGDQSALDQLIEMTKVLQTSFEHIKGCPSCSETVGPTLQGIIDTLHQITSSLTEAHGGEPRAMVLLDGAPGTAAPGIAAPGTAALGTAAPGTAGPVSPEQDMIPSAPAIEEEECVPFNVVSSDPECAILCWRDSEEFAVAEGEPPAPRAYVTSDLNCAILCWDDTSFEKVKQMPLAVKPPELESKGLEEGQLLTTVAFGAATTEPLSVSADIKDTSGPAVSAVAERISQESFEYSEECYSRLSGEDFGFGEQGSFVLEQGKLCDFTDSELDLPFEEDAESVYVNPQERLFQNEFPECLAYFESLGERLGQVVMVEEYKTVQADITAFDKDISPVHVVAEEKVSGEGKVIQENVGAVPEKGLYTHGTGEGTTITLLVEAKVSPSSFTESIYSRISAEDFLFGDTGSFVLEASKICKFTDSELELPFEEEVESVYLGSTERLFQDEFPESAKLIPLTVKPIVVTEVILPQAKPVVPEAATEPVPVSVITAPTGLEPMEDRLIEQPTSSTGELRDEIYNDVFGRTTAGTGADHVVTDVSAMPSEAVEVVRKLEDELTSEIADILSELLARFEGAPLEKSELAEIQRLLYDLLGKCSLVGADIEKAAGIEIVLAEVLTTEEGLPTGAPDALDVQDISTAVPEVSYRTQDAGGPEPLDIQEILADVITKCVNTGKLDISDVSRIASNVIAKSQGKAPEKPTIPGKDPTSEEAPEGAVEETEFQVIIEDTVITPVEEGTLELGIEKGAEEQTIVSEVGGPPKIPEKLEMLRDGVIPHKQDTVIKKPVCTCEDPMPEEAPEAEMQLQVVIEDTGNAPVEEGMLEIGVVKGAEERTIVPEVESRSGQEEHVMPIAAVMEPPKEVESPSAQEKPVMPISAVMEPPKEVESPSAQEEPIMPIAAVMEPPKEVESLSAQDKPVMPIAAVKEPPKAVESPSAQEKPVMPIDAVMTPPKEYEFTNNELEMPFVEAEPIVELKTDERVFQNEFSGIVTTTTKPLAVTTGTVEEISVVGEVVVPPEDREEEIFFEAVGEALPQEKIVEESILKEKRPEYVVEGNLEKQLVSLQQRVSYKSKEIIEIKTLLSQLQQQQTRLEGTMGMGPSQFPEVVMLEEDYTKPIAVTPGVRPSASELQAAIASLKDKCRVKDHMIGAMVEELRARAQSGIWNELKTRIASAEMPQPDYTRSQLVEYLTPDEQFPPLLVESAGPCSCSGDAKSTSMAVCLPPTREERACVTAQPPSHPMPGMTPVSTCTCPGDFRIMRKIGADSLLLGWQIPASSANLSGYDIYVNGILQCKVWSGTRNRALLHCLDLSSPMVILLYGRTTGGQLSGPARITYSGGV